MSIRSHVTRYGGWLPEHHRTFHSFVKKHGRAPHRGGVHSPPIKAFEKAVRDDPVILNLMEQTFLQSDKVNTIRNFETLLHLLDKIVQTAPTFYVEKDENGNDVGEPIGIPIYLVFDILSNTSAGYDLFRLPKFNAILKKLLDVWGAFLMTEPSNAVLNTGPEGWFSNTAVSVLDEGRGGTFNDVYVVPNPEAENRGYKSWDHFFTRDVRKEARPIHFPENKSLIHSACESTVYHVAKKIQEHDKFWLKGQTYSLYDMFNRDAEQAAKFIGGTVFQAFLSPLDYHRWHSPIDGTVKKTVLVPGTYYAALTDEGEKEPDGSLNPRGTLIRSQAFLTLSAARALIFIESDNPAIGLMCFIGVGMCEVSSCQIAVEPGQRINTGEQLGMFHFGGSSHALIFGPQVNIVFADGVRENEHIWVNSIIAQVQDK